MTECNTKTVLGPIYIVFLRCRSATPPIVILRRSSSWSPSPSSLLPTAIIQLRTVYHCCYFAYPRGFAVDRKWFFPLVIAFSLNFYLIRCVRAHSINLFWTLVFQSHGTNYVSKHVRAYSGHASARSSSHSHRAFKRSQGVQRWDSSV